MKTFESMTNQVNAIHTKELMRVVRIAHKKGGRDNLKNDNTKALYDEAVAQGITLEQAMAAMPARRIRKA
tara:strand:- start:59882 stop:60091 length:210 start_codon:yes stop_codon:yes gene_type:complete